MISNHSIEKVRNLSISDIVGKYVNLTRRGSSLMGLCPFHQERTGSFSVSPQKNLYHCFSCNRGGDGISFIMEKENLSFSDAVQFIAKNHNIPLERSNEDLNEQEKAEAKHKEALLATMDAVQKFFLENLRANRCDESDHARAYAYERWPEEFCSFAGIGYAPADSESFFDFCERQSISQDILFELGLLRRNEEGKVHAMFRQRIMIPIRNRWGRIIAYTARHIGHSAKAPKYINSTNSTIYKKGDTLFGIDRAARQRNVSYIIVVEGAPDVLRMQSIGMENTVASLGTAWSDNQFNQIKKITSSLCFIPDSDVDESSAYGPGFKAVMANGSMAVKKGFHVTVRELPFEQVALSAQELNDMYPDGIPDDAPTMKMAKNDADSYITCRNDYDTLQEKHFIIWLAQKRFYEANSLVEERKVVSEIAGLLRYIKDQLEFDQCIDQLAKVHGRAKLWRDAVTQSRNEAKRLQDKSVTMNEKQKMADLLRQYGLFVRNNCYYSIASDDDDDSPMISNFIMEPLFHIEDDFNATRLFRMRNCNNETRIIELKESELCSLNTFQQKVGSIGNYVWQGTIVKLNSLKGYLYSQTDTAERLLKLGWNGIEGFYAFGNGIVVDGEFRPVNELGIVRSHNEKAFYIPATAKMFSLKPEIYQFERLMIHENRNGIKLYDFAVQLIKVFGENATVALSYLFSTIFRDVIFAKTRHFPILNLFGEKGTGKTTLATSLQSFFLHGIDPPNLGVASVPAMNDRVAQAVNMLLVLDEYKNDLDIRKIAYLKGLWGGGGQTKKNIGGDGVASQTIVTTGVVLCGQDKPTQDMALYTRVLFLPYTKTSFNQGERRAYDDLVSLCNLGLTHLTIEILKHRELFEKNFNETYAITKRELALRIEDETIHDRIFGNWLIPLTTFRILETAIKMPFTFADLFETTIKGMRNQNELAQESSEIADFWNMLQGFQTTGKCIEKAHFKITYMKEFRPMFMNESIEFNESTPILFLNAAAVESLFSGRSTNSTANRSNWSTILSYLKSNPAFLGLKQHRFVVLQSNGTPEYSVGVENGEQVKKVKINRPKALCFNYAVLQDSFGLNLETEVITDDDDMM